MANKTYNLADAAYSFLLVLLVSGGCSTSVTDTGDQRTPTYQSSPWVKPARESAGAKWSISVPNGRLANVSLYFLQVDPLVANPRKYIALYGFSHDNAEEFFPPYGQISFSASELSGGIRVYDSDTFASFIILTPLAAARRGVPLPRDVRNPSRFIHSMSVSPDTFVFTGTAEEAAMFQSWGAAITPLKPAQMASPVREPAQRPLNQTGTTVSRDNINNSSERETVKEDLQLPAGLQKHNDTFDRVSRIYNRLLTQPLEPRKQNWMLWEQIRDETTPEEKAIVMASFEGGQFTAVDWFAALHDIAPPARPRNLNTASGVEDFLDKYLLSKKYFDARIAAQPWVSAQIVHTIEAYQDYIEKYPESKYTPQARKRIEYLNTRK